MNQQNDFEKVAITVVGTSNTGKTMVIKEIDRLIDIYYDNIETIVEKTYIQKSKADYYRIIKINNHIVGICTFCDIAWKITRGFLPICVDHNCDLLIMARRTRGNIKRALENRFNAYTEKAIEVNYVNGDDIDKWKSFMSVKEENIEEIRKLIDGHLEQ